VVRRIGADIFSDVSPTRAGTLTVITGPRERRDPVISLLRRGWIAGSPPGDDGGVFCKDMRSLSGSSPSPTSEQRNSKILVPFLRPVMTAMPC